MTPAERATSPTHFRPLVPRAPGSWRNTGARAARTATISINTPLVDSIGLLLDPVNLRCRPQGPWQGPGKDSRRTLLHSGGRLAPDPPSGRHHATPLTRLSVCLGLLFSHEMRLLLRDVDGGRPLTRIRELVTEPGYERAMAPGRA